MDQSTNKFYHKDDSKGKLAIIYDRCEAKSIGFVPEWRTGVTIKLTPEEEEIKVATKQLKDLLEELREKYAHPWTYNTL